MNTSNLRQMNLTSHYPVFERDHRSIYRTRYSLKDHYVASSLCKEIFRLPYIHTYISGVSKIWLIITYRVRPNDTYKRAPGDSLWENKKKIWSAIFFLFKAQFARKSNSKICQVYWNMANFREKPIFKFIIRLYSVDF